MGRQATRFTDNPISDAFPVWSPNGSRIAFSSTREGSFDVLYIKSTSGAGQEEVLLKTGNSKVASGWSNDGQLLLYSEMDLKTGSDLWVMPMEGERKPVRFPGTEFNESEAAFSPNGKWIADASDETGRLAIYVQAYPATGARWQVSKDGGTRPMWRRDGKELYWLTESGTLLAADVAAGPTLFQSATPQLLFETRITDRVDLYAVSGDGKRFLIPVPVESDGNRSATVIENWLEAAKRKPGRSGTVANPQPQEANTIREPELPFWQYGVMAMRKTTFSVPEPLAVQFLHRVASRDRLRFVSEALAVRLAERYAALIRACEIANQDIDLAEIESEFDALSDGMAERWR